MTIQEEFHICTTHYAFVGQKADIQKLVSKINWEEDKGKQPIVAIGDGLPGFDSAEHEGFVVSVALAEDNLLFVEVETPRTPDDVFWTSLIEGLHLNSVRFTYIAISPYENIYLVCDPRGLCIWQDCFACVEGDSRFPIKGECTKNEFIDSALQYLKIQRDEAENKAVISSQGLADYLIDQVELNSLAEVYQQVDTKQVKIHKFLHTRTLGKYSTVECTSVFSSR